MKNDWVIYAVIAGGVIGVVFVVKKFVTGSGSGGNSASKNSVVTTVAAAGTRQLVDQTGNAAIGVTEGLYEGDQDIGNEIQPVTVYTPLGAAAYGAGYVSGFDSDPVLATGSTDQQTAADDYVASMGGYVAPGLPE